MNAKELIMDIRSELIYKEEIRNGIWSLKTEKYQEFTHFCHGDLLPDDYRYEMIVKALDILSNTEDLDDIDASDEIDNTVPVYTHDLTSWLGSNNSRYSYCDEFAEDYGFKDTISLISGGYYKEMGEVFYLALNWIKTHSEEE